VSLSKRRQSAPLSRSAFAGCRFPVEVVTVAVRWYLRYGLSYRDVEELLAERGIEVDHVTVYRWVQRFTPLFADAARFTRHAPGRRLVCRRNPRQSQRRVALRVPCRRPARPGHRRTGISPARRRGRPPLLTPGIDHAESDTPTEIVTDAAPVYPRVLDELLPAAWHHVEQHANNRIEADHSRLKQRLRPMRGLHTDRTARVIIAGIAFMQNLRRGHYEIATETPQPLRVAAAFTELARAI
jgi:transposase, IS6 family